MSLEIAFPLEFIVKRTPPAIGSSSSSRAAWKEVSATAAKAVMGERNWQTFASVSVIILYFSDGPMQGDIDNIAKRTIDALKHVVYADDRQVDRVMLRKFELRGGLTLMGASPTLITAVSEEPPVTYVRVDTDRSRGPAPWL